MAQQNSCKSTIPSLIEISHVEWTLLLAKRRTYFHYKIQLKQLSNISNSLFLYKQHHKVLTLHITVCVLVLPTAFLNFVTRLQI